MSLRKERKKEIKKWCSANWKFTNKGIYSIFLSNVISEIKKDYPIGNSWKSKWQAELMTLFLGLGTQADSS